MFGSEVDLLVLLFVVGLVAAAIDAIAGGGGLMTVPALLLTGLGPVETLATNKFQGSFGSVTSSVVFWRRGLVEPRIALPMGVLSAAGATLGALSVGMISRAALETAIPVMLIAIAVYFLFARRMTDADSRARMGNGFVTVALVPVIGFYDGIFGPGTGTFFMLAFVTLLGFGVLRATVHTKVANAGSNLGSLAVFWAMGAIDFKIGLVMAAGAFTGAQLGSRLAMRFGADLIRPLLVVICCALAIKLLADPKNPIRRMMGGEAVSSVQAPTFGSRCNALQINCRRYKEHWQPYDSRVAFASDVWF